jgi:hypothetical protein
MWATKHNLFFGALFRFPIMVVTTALAFLAIGSSFVFSHIIHRGKAPFLSFDLLAVVTLFHGFMVGYIQASSDTAQKVSLWLICCEILNIAPSDVTIFNYPNSVLIGRLVALDRKTTIK